MHAARPIQLPVNQGRRMSVGEVPTLGSNQSLSPAAPHKCSELQEEIMAEELLKVMNFAASKIQALWRGYCTRKQLYIEQGAAMLLQAFWRGYQVRRLLREPVSRPLQIHGQHLRWKRDCVKTQDQQQWRLEAGQVQSQSKHHWQQNIQPVQLPIQQSQKCSYNLQSKILAVTTIQAYWRGYVARRDLAIKIGAAIFIQSFFRGYLVRRNLNPNSTPNPAPQDEEAKMVAYNMSFTPGNSKMQNPDPPSPQHKSGSFQAASGPRRMSSNGTKLPENPFGLHPGNNDSVSGKGDTVEPTKARPLLSWSPGSGEVNCSSGTMTTIQMARNPKNNIFVPEYFIEGAGDTTSLDSRFGGVHTRQKCISSVRGGKEKSLDELNLEKWQKHQNAKSKERTSQQNILGITAARPRYTYRNQEKADGKEEGNKPASQYLVQSTSYTPDSPRKLIRFREDPNLDSCQHNQLETSNEVPASEPDFNFSDLEVSRDAVTCLSKSSPRKTLKQIREESAAAGTIQAVWKGHLTRKSLRQQADAATKIQAIFRSYRIRKEFENEGIFPLNYVKKPSKYVSKDSRTGAVMRRRSYCVSVAPHTSPGSQKPGNRAADFTAASPPRDPQGTSDNYGYVNSGLETCIQPPQTLKIVGGDPPICTPTSHTTVLDKDVTASTPPPAAPNCKLAPGKESGKTSHLYQINHWAQRSIQSRRHHWEKVKAACTIQAAWRGNQARYTIRKQRQAAVKIQALFRGFQIRKLLSSIERQGEEPNKSRECPETLTGDAPEYLYLKTEAAAGCNSREPPSDRVAKTSVEPCCQHNPAWRALAKPDGPAIFVKRNPCYNPRKVTIHVKAAAGEMS